MPTSIPIAIADEDDPVATYISAWGAVMRIRIETGDPSAIPQMTSYAKGSHRGGFCLPDVALKAAEVQKHLGDLRFWAEALGTNEPTEIKARAPTMVKAAIKLWAFGDYRLNRLVERFLLDEVRPLLAAKLGLSKRRRQKAA